MNYNELGDDMSVLNRIAYLQGRRDEVPNQELAKELAGARNEAGIREIAENLRNPDKNIQFDCVKVLYEIGYVSPDLIAGYVDDFLRLLKNKHNRLVWGGMLALSTIAGLRPKEIYENLETIYSTVREGSVITVDGGIKVLSKLASDNAAYNKKIFPFLIDHLKNCRPKDVPQHSESIVEAVNPGNRNDFLSVLRHREVEMSPSQVARIRRLYKKIG